MPNFHFPWHDSIPEPDPDPEPAPPPPMPPIFGQPAPPAQPLDPWVGDPPRPSWYDHLDKLPATDRCIICGAPVPRDLDAFCARHETVADVAFAVYVGELSEWPGQCVNDRVMMATHPESLGLRKVPWQATVTAILSAAGVWLEDMPPGD